VPGGRGRASTGALALKVYEFVIEQICGIDSLKRHQCISSLEFEYQCEQDTIGRLFSGLSAELV
jgi:hypothetical protein